MLDIKTLILALTVHTKYTLVRPVFIFHFTYLVLGIIIPLGANLILRYRFIIFPLRPLVGPNSRTTGNRIGAGIHGAQLENRPGAPEPKSRIFTLCIKKSLIFQSIFLKQPGIVLLPAT